MFRSHRAQQLRKTVLGLFGPQARAATQQMWCFDAMDWRRTIAWLDSSGMALYLLARVKQLEIDGLLPPNVLVRLQQNHAENSSRTAWLFDQMAEITACFNANQIPFAFLKGLTLVPDAVPDPTLRCQADIDLVASRAHASAIGEMLKAKGYVLHADEKGTAEFRTVSTALGSRAQMYQVRPQRAIEVHWVAEDKTGQRASTWRGQLDRAHTRNIKDVLIPCLSQPDQLLNQMLHLFGHLRGEHTRAAWILELTRHLEARRSDNSFWNDFRQVLRSVPEASLACGSTLALIEEVFGYEAPPQVADFAHELPPAVLHWLKTYGMRVAIADAPGSKLYLLLETALAPGSRGASELRRSRLLPRRLPPMVMHGPAGASVSDRLKRYSAQLWFVSYRLRFHAHALMEYVVERARWARAAKAIGF